MNAKLAALQARGEEVRRLLDSSTADRARANRCYEETRDGLTQLASEVETPKSDWGLLLNRAETLGREFDRAERLAREDIWLSHQAREALQEAVHEHRAARSFLRSGVSADVSGVGGVLDRAKDALGNSAYEEVIQFAERAARAARDAREEADAEARRVERRRREERRRAEARRRRLSQSSGFSRSGSSFSGSSSSSFSSGSSSSSFSSGTSQSSW